MVRDWSTHVFLPVLDALHYLSEYRIDLVSRLHAVTGRGRRRRAAPSTKENVMTDITAIVV